MIPIATPRRPPLARDQGPSQDIFSAKSPGCSSSHRLAEAPLRCCLYRPLRTLS